ncbi:MAG: tetratricopeptide repeat protein [Deltaproteobacteria bacterium]
MSENADAYNEQGNALVNSGRYEDAIKFYDKAIELDPAYVWARRNKGLALSKMGKREEALKLYDEALDIDPNYTDAWNDKGVALYYLFRDKEALECYDKALELDPNYFDANYNKALALYNSGGYEEAQKSFERALEIRPDDTWTHSSLANTLVKLGKLDDAKSHAARAVATAPQDPYALIAEGNLYDALGNYAAAEESYQRAVDLDAKNIDALHAIGLLYAEHTFEFDKSLGIWRRIFEINPASASAKANLADILIQTANSEEGRRYASELLKETQNAEYRIFLKFLIAASHLMDGDREGGARALAEFFAEYRADENLKLGEGKWVFKSWFKSISERAVPLDVRFLLLSLIDLMQGRIDWRKLSFFSGGKAESSFS